MVSFWECLQHVSLGVVLSYVQGVCVCVIIACQCLLFWPQFGLQYRYCRYCIKMTHLLMDALVKLFQVLQYPCLLYLRSLSSYLTSFSGYFRLLASLRLPEVKMDAPILVDPRWSRVWTVKSCKDSDFDELCSGNLTVMTVGGSLAMLLLFIQTDRNTGGKTERSEKDKGGQRSSYGEPKWKWGMKESWFLEEQHGGGDGWRETGRSRGEKQSQKAAWEKSVPIFSGCLET